MKRPVLKTIAASTLALSLLVPVSAAAQDPDPASTARLHLGPLALTPTIALTNVGVDTNVFNESDSQKQDFTTTLTPQADWWLHLGRARVSGKTTWSFVYYRRYVSQRSANTSNRVNVEVPLNRFRPHVSDLFLNSRQRFSPEIDLRSRHRENTVSVGSEVRLTSKTSVDVTVRQFIMRFDANDVFLDTSLREALDRHGDGVAASLRYALTPLTTLVFTADAQRDRFDFSHVRDSDTVHISPGVEFKPFALIGGSAHVGFRKFVSLAPGVPNSRGVFASVDLNYTLLGVTRFDVQFNRDVTYSLEKQAPYFVQTDARASVSQSVTSAWDVVATAGRQHLNYRLVAGAPGFGEPRIDTLTTYGGGLGYRFGRGKRLGVNIDYYRRQSRLTGRRFKGLRIGSSLTYGL